MITQDMLGNCLVLRLDRAVINAINGQLVEALAASFADAAESPSNEAVVLSSTGDKFFSIGLDIPSLYPLNRDEFRRFLHSFNRLTLQMLTFPKPLVAAIRGHAVAGGCILALGCDYRVMAEGKKLIGLNEAKLGVPVPYPALRALIEVVGGRVAREVVDFAEFYPPDRALALGLVDLVVPPDQVESAAVERAKRLAEIPSAVYARINQDRRRPMIDDIERCLAETERAFLDHWFSPATRDTLRQAAEKFRS